MLRVSASVAMIFALTSMSAQADIINGSFEDGFAGWNVAGLTGVVGEVGPHTPTDGRLQAALESNWFFFDGATDDEISDLLGLPRLTVANPFYPERPRSDPTLNTNLFELLRQDAYTGEGPLNQCFGNDNCFTDGAVVYQTFEAKAGQRLSFDWNLLGRDVWTPDSAFVTLTGHGFTTAVLLSDTGGSAASAIRPERNNILPIDPAFGDVLLLCDAEIVNGIYCDGPLAIEGGATGYQSYSLDIPGSGAVTLGFTLLNSSGPSNEAGFLIDDVRIVDVAEPGTFALLGAGLIGIGFARRRKKA